MVITPNNYEIMDLFRTIILEDLIKLDDVNENNCELSSKSKTK